MGGNLDVIFSLRTLRLSDLCVKSFDFLPYEKKAGEAGQVVPRSPFSPFRGTGEPDGGRLTGRVLAYILKPAKHKKGYSLNEKIA